MVDSQERALLSRCLKGDSEAWSELFDLHYAAAGRFVFQLSPHFTREDVEEICQETFISVIKNLPSFQGNCQVQTWVFRIAANKAKDYRERQRASKRGGGAIPISLNQDPEEDGRRPVDPPSLAPGPDANLLREEDADLVGRALDRLGGPCQEIIELRYFGDLSYEEISKTLHLNPKTVSSRLSKCLDKLEALLKKELQREIKTPNAV